MFVYYVYVNFTVKSMKGYLFKILLRFNDLRILWNGQTQDITFLCKAKNISIDLMIIILEDFVQTQVQPFNYMLS